jgi:uncharacterized protein (DUF305 family)
MKSPLRKIATLVSLSLLALTGCAQATVSETTATLSSVDKTFLEMMIPHHNQAVEMSHLAEKNTTNPEILALAKLIDEEQHHEIDLMSQWLGTKGGHDHSHDDHQMDGMLSADQMKELEQAKDAEFDRLFLEGMIVHHEGAIEMTQMVTSSDNPDVRNLANSIIDSQTEQIRQMRELLESLN